MWLNDKDREALNRNLHKGNIPPSAYHKTDFKGEYLGGHPMYHQKQKVWLILKEDSLHIEYRKNYSPWFQISYDKILQAEVIPQSQVNTIIGSIYGLPFALQWEKTDKFLAITFMHESGVAQTMLFKAEDAMGARLEISSKAEEYQRKH